MFENSIMVERELLCFLPPKLVRRGAGRVQEAEAGVISQPAALCSLNRVDYRLPSLSKIQS
jgi:hypothetical protein